MSRRATILALTLFPALIAPAQQKPPFWETTDWHQWTKSQCAQILRQSPWAISETECESRTIEGGVAYTTCANVPRYDDNCPFPTIYTASSVREDCKNILNVQLRSALPIRQALLRQFQHQVNYNRLKTDQRRLVDQQVEANLTRSFDQYVYIHIELSVEGRGMAYGRWLRKTYRYQKVHLSFALELPDGRVVEAARVIQTRNDTQWIAYDALFPRFINGNPLFLPSDKTAKLVVTKLNFAAQVLALATKEGGVSKRVVEFPVNQWMYRGKLEY
jgi:hypothetical protein